MVCIGTAVQHPGPARVISTVSATIGFTVSVVESYGRDVDVTFMRTSPHLGNRSGTGVIVTIVTIGRGGELLIFPFPGWHRGITCTSDEQYMNNQA